MFVQKVTKLITYFCKRRLPKHSCLYIKLLQSWKCLHVPVAIEASLFRLLLTHPLNYVMHATTAHMYEIYDHSVVYNLIINNRFSGVSTGFDDYLYNYNPCAPFTEQGGNRANVHVRI